MKYKNLMNVAVLLIGFVIGWKIIRHRQQVQYTLFTQQCETAAERQREIETEKPQKLDLVRSEGREPLMVGIMTTYRNLATRASAVYSTWGRDVPGRVVFYVGQKKVSNIKSPHSPHREPVKLINNLPVVELEGVKDGAYPPRSKSFAMLNHMLHNFGRQYQWYFRCDDDLYIRLEELVRYLLSVDNSRLWYIGNPAMGFGREKGHLGLEKPYCMGGPGVTFSPPALRLVVPHLDKCNGEPASGHEDTELGRCMWKHVHIHCTCDRKRGQEVFHHAFNLDKARKSISSFITLHPGKKPDVMHSFHLASLFQKLQRLQDRHRQLVVDLHVTNVILAKASTDVSHRSLVSSARHWDIVNYIMEKQRFQQGIKSGETKWLNSFNFILFKVKEWFGFKDAKITTEKDLKETEFIRLELLLDDHPIWDYTIRDKTYVLNAVKLHPVKETAIHKANEELTTFTKSHGLSELTQKQQLAKYQSVSLTHGLQHIITLSNNKGYRSFLLSSKFEYLQWEEKDHLTFHVPATKTTDKQTGPKPQQSQPAKSTPDVKNPSSSKQDRATVTSSWPILHIVLPLYNRYQSYPNFLGNLTVAATHYLGSIHLHVALYAESLGQNKLNPSANKTNKNLNISVRNMKGNFSRGVELNKLSEGIQGNSILIFMDVDLILNEAFLHRVAINVAPRQAYFPIYFSLYTSKAVCYDRSSNCTVAQCDFSADCGRWQEDDGFTVVAMTAGDLKKTGGLSTDISGGNDVKQHDFYKSCLSRDIQVMRTPDPGMQHLFHNQSCDQTLSTQAKSTCKSSALSLYGSVSTLAQRVWDIEQKG